MIIYDRLFILILVVKVRLQIKSLTPYSNYAILEVSTSSVISALLARLCYKKKPNQVAHLLLLSMVKTYRPGMDLIKIKNNSYIISPWLWSSLCPLVRNWCYLSNLIPVSFPSSTNYSWLRLSITSTHMYKEISSTALKCYNTRKLLVCVQKVDQPTTADTNACCLKRVHYLLLHWLQER